MSQGALSLDEEDFWANPFKTRDEIEERLLLEDKDALLVDAPREVALGAQETVPIVVLRVASLARLNEVGFDQQALITAVDLTTNSAYADLAVFHTGRNVAPPETSSEPPQPGMGAEAFVVDAMKRLDLTARPARYVMRIILRDEVSQPLFVSLIEAPGRYQDPAVQTFRQQEQANAPIPPRWPAPGVPWPRYERLENSPPIPESVGLNLVTDRVSVIGETQSLILYGSYRLPVLPQHVVPSEIQQASERASWIRALKEDEPEPTAVIPITFVVTGSESATPFVWRIVVPCYDALERSDGTITATGVFALDLMQLGRLDSLEQTWFLYALSGEALAGPVTMAFVRRQIVK